MQNLNLWLVGLVLTELPAGSPCRDHCTKIALKGDKSFFHLLPCFYLSVLASKRSFHLFAHLRTLKAWLHGECRWVCFSDSPILSTTFSSHPAHQKHSCCLQTSAIQLHSHCPHAYISSGAPLKHSAQLGTRNKARSYPFSRAVGPFSQVISPLPAKLHHCNQRLGKTAAFARSSASARHTGAGTPSFARGEAHRSAAHIKRTT